MCDKRTIKYRKMPTQSGGMEHRMSRCVVILGGTGGMGICTVRNFFEKEKCDIITISMSQPEIDAANKEFANPNGSFTAYYASVTDQAEIARIYKEIDEKYGKIDCLVNAVGTLISGNIEQLSLDAFKKMLDVNLIGVYIALQEAIPYLKKSKSAYVVNISSISSKLGGSSIGYSVAKTGVDMLTREAARELAPYNIHVNSINPGMTRTGLQIK
ncbi:MAG: SDR family oxidoreductase, partial [Clostridiales bacterium]|nr:SDR family oxidoreductase [Clostridiales bacterium]